MRRRAIAVLVGMLCAANVYAELQTVVVGGELRVRGRFWSDVYANDINGPRDVRFPAFFLPARAIGPFGTNSRYDWDSRGNDLSFVEQRTRLSVRADFTDDVSAFTEIEAFERWGEDFRSDYITAADFKTTTADDLEVYQAYIQTQNTFGYPLRLRIGRQEMKFGKGWLADDITTAMLGRSYDAIRLTYTGDNFSIDAWWSKLADNSPAEQDGDIDFSGIYTTCTAVDWMSFSAYWMWIRDARSINDTNLAWFPERVEDILGVDNYDVTNIHTFGLRAWGKYEAWDYDLELAYQAGNADQVGSRFSAFTYGDDGANFGHWAGDLEAGYTFDMNWAPRVYLGGAYFGGEDNRDLSFWDWLNPFDKPDASVSFNRLFPGKPYSSVLEIGQDMSNFYQIRGGVEAHPTEAVTAGLQVAYFGVVAPFDMPRVFSVGRFRVPIAPSLSFWTQESSDDIGVTTHLWAKYNYSSDLYFKVGWEHLFTGDGMADGNFNHRYGLEFSGGTDDEDADYFYFDTGLKF